MDIIQNQNIEAITLLVTKLGSAFNTDVREETVIEYVEVLSKCNLADVEACVEEAKFKLDRFPSIHKMLTMMGIDTGPETVEEEAGFMFDSIRRLRKKEYDPSIFNEVVSNCIRVMGGRGKLPTSFLGWDQKHEWEKRQQFIRNYKEFSKRFGRQSVLVIKTTMIEEKKEFHQTPFERLQSNRAAFEVRRQSLECTATGKNCWDPAKVKAASQDPSKDDQVNERYGTKLPNPAEIFGNMARP